MSRRIHPAVAPAQPFQLARREEIEGSVLGTDEARQRIEALRSRYPDSRAALLPLLGFVQARRGWVTAGDMVEVAGALDLTPAYVRSVATFYTMYNKHPVGRYLVQVCTCISCHLLKAQEVFERFLEETGTRAGEISEDGLFTVIEAECLGACGFATAVQVNDEYFENVAPDTVTDILSELRARPLPDTNGAGDGGPDAAADGDEAE